MIKGKDQLLFFIVVLFSIFSCIPVAEKEEIPFDVTFQNPLIRHLYELQVRQARDSLLNYLSHEDPSVRYAAARAFASFQDSTSLPSLLPLLRDPNSQVRAMAAEAIGLIGASGAEAQLAASFDGRDSARLYQIANGDILEAMGRVGGMQFLHALSTISNYQRIDTLLLLGQARGVYRYALRGMIDPEGTATLVNYFTDPDMPFEVRLMAGNYLHRSQNIDLTPFSDRLTSLWHSESHPHLRMCLATAFGKIKSASTRDLLVQSIATESDYRVKCNILRSLQSHSYDEVSPVIIEYAKSGHPALAEVAAQYFVQHGIPGDASLYRSTMDECKTWQAKTRMAEAANKNMSNMLAGAKISLMRDIQHSLEQTADSYEKAAWLKAWASEVRNFESIPKYMSSEHPAVIKTQAVQSLIDVCKNKNFDAYFAGEGHLIRSQIGGYLANAIRSGDPGMLALIAGAITDEETGLKEVLRDQKNELSKAMSKLTLPAEMETYIELSKALEEYNVESPPMMEEQRSVKKIDWDIFQKLAPETKATIVTSAGDITMSFYPERAPGSVVNFIQLAEQHFYDAKAFHRVVPNFVIQTGCPRGDGFGSLDFTIRSELAEAYYNDEGYVGMASAGPHTEGTQFFITHSPAPHLDGRYTIFGKVISGMDVVHKISVGDTLKEIKIIY